MKTLKHRVLPSLPRRLRFLKCFAHYLWLDQPRSISWAITGGCDARCIFCEAPTQLSFQKDLRLERALQLVDEMSMLNVKEVVIVGGEPLVRKDLWQILEHLADKKIRVLLVTNGFLISSLSQEKLGLLRRCVSEIRVSLDSTSSQQHDHIRGVNKSFERAFAGLQVLRRLEGPEISLNVVVMNTNQSEIPKLIELGATLGVRAIYFQPVSTITIFTDSFPLAEKEKLMLSKESDFEELARNIDAGLKTAKDLKVFTTLPIFQTFAIPYFREFAGRRDGDGFYFDRVVKEFVCLAALWEAFIDYDGSFKPCAVLAPTGNLKESRLEKEWAKLAHFRMNVKEGKLPKECQSCFCNIGGGIVFSALRSPVRNWRVLKKIAAMF